MKTKTMRKKPQKDSQGQMLLGIEVSQVSKPVRPLNEYAKIFSQANLDEAKRRAKEYVEGLRQRIRLGNAQIAYEKERAALAKKDVRFRQPKVDAYKLAWKIIESPNHGKQSPQKRAAWIIVNALSYRRRDGGIKRSFAPRADNLKSLNFDGVSLGRVEAFIKEYGKLFPN
ncbi:MAG: hypothetical protein WC308_03945 [archaeon]|jgi:hypothetical protein